MSQPIQPVVYPPPGRCIYCGRTDGPLSNEHIIPRGLGGDLILRNASCTDCARIISQIEAFCLRAMFGSARVRMNLPTYNPKQRGSTFKIEREFNDGHIETEEIPVEKLPLIVPGYRFPPPGLIRGEAESDEFSATVRFSDDLFEHLRPDSTFPLAKMDVYVFARLLAKIAHAYFFAVHNLSPVTRDIEAYNLLLPDLILGKANTAPALVGGPSDINRPKPPEPKLYDIGLKYYWHDLVQPYIVVKIRLFAFWDVPEYQVLVATMPTFLSRQQRF